MNHVYRLVWNPTLQALVAVCESARGRGKGGSKAKTTGALLSDWLVGQLRPRHHQGALGAPLG